MERSSSLECLSTDTPTSASTTVGETGTPGATGPWQLYSNDSFDNTLKNGRFQARYTANNQVAGKHTIWLELATVSGDQSLNARHRMIYSQCLEARSGDGDAA